MSSKERLSKLRRLTKLRRARSRAALRLAHRPPSRRLARAGAR